MVPFSVIAFGVVVWTIAVSGAKQVRFFVFNSNISSADFPPSEI